jgi:mono/diheme cytochrome c family protein
MKLFLQTPAAPRRSPWPARFPWIVLVLLVSIAGCDSPAARFRGNAVYFRKQEEAVGEQFVAQQKQDVSDALAALFGTPDEPFIVTDVPLGTDSVFDLEKLSIAAGPVGSDEHGRPRGLFRQHCAHCHGITGDGAGPTAPFMNPYPRDYRRGVFKFKSTPKGGKPTDDDLRRVLVNGIPGTSMPSFRLLPETEIDALIQYVKYLSVRGELERSLIDESSDLDAAGGDRLDQGRENLLEDKLARVVRQWQMASSQVTPIPARPEMNDGQLQVSIRHGRELFYGLGECVKCHGDTQLGDGEAKDYDDWTKDYYDWSKSMDQEKLAAFLGLGGFPPRNIRPRNLREGVYRGGRRPIDIFWRIHNGIDGTPMPGAPMRPEGAPADAVGFTTDDLWDLINYVQSLPYEALSQPVSHDATVSKEVF